MASAKEIKNRISGIQSTQKITNAMYLISSTKMERAKRELNKTRPYFTALRTGINRMFRTAEDVSSRYIYAPEQEEVLSGDRGILVITADRGLAGAYNQNVIKEAQNLIDDQSKLFVVGEYGRHYYMKHHMPIEQSFLYTAQNPTMQRAREITRVLLGQFDDGLLGEIYVVYTDLKSQMAEEAISVRLLPFYQKHFVEEDEEKITQVFEYRPSVNDVLDTMMRSYTAGFVYSALVDSFCCEQNARMTAMHSANDNAQSIIAELSVEYNRVRQAAITQEITEVSAGAKAQKRK